VRFGRDSECRLKESSFLKFVDLRAAPQKSGFLLLSRIVNAGVGLYYLLRKWMSVFVVSDTPI
jgi:hypothetical protein